MIERIKNSLKNDRVTLVGFTNTRDLETFGEIDLLPFAISIGIKLSDMVLKTVSDRPSLIYKHHYRIINNHLDFAALRLTRFLEDSGHKALPIPASQLIDWERQLGHLSHRDIARKAGLGWIGRSGLLVNPQYGARVRYVSVLTNLELPDAEEIPFGCDDCSCCISACPAQAISKDGVNIRRCYEKLNEFSKIRGIGQHICGVCVKVCPGSGLHISHSF